MENLGIRYPFQPATLEMRPDRAHAEIARAPCLEDVEKRKLAEADMQRRLAAGSQRCR
jgi:hypothetical protein